jgi:hypothetical protein
MAHLIVTRLDHNDAGALAPAFTEIHKALNDSSGPAHL